MSHRDRRQMPLRTVIFDLDGVLIDSEPLMRFAFAASYRKVIGTGTPPIEAYLEHMGESFPQIMAHLNLPLTLWQPYRELCQQRLDLITVFSEGRSLLRWAAGAGLQLALLTGKDRGRTIHLLDHFGLLQFFDTIVCSDELEQPKPDPEGIVRILDVLQATAAETVMIGDAVSDVLCAQRAAVSTIAVTWGIKPERVQTMCQPDYIIHSWAALTELIQDMAAGSARGDLGENHTELHRHH